MLGQVRGSMAAALLLLAAGVSAVRAERPAAADLLPKETVLYLRVPHVPTLSEKFLETSVGRMSQDEQLRPLIQQLYGSAAESWVNVREELDLELGELLAIPQGEFALALVPVVDERPAVVLLVDVGAQWPAAQKVLERLTAQLEGQGAAKTEQQVGETKLTTYEITGRRTRRVSWAEREGTLLIATDAELAKGMLARWSGEGEGETLRANERFTAIMGSVRGNRDEQVQFTWFADPIAAAKAIARDGAAQVGLALLPALGLDGWQGVGGSVALATDEFDTITHIHVLLDNPRAGVIELLALGAGDLTPEPWVASDVASYTTAYVDHEVAYEKLQKLYDSFRGEGAWAEVVQQRASERLGVDVPNDVLPALTGRVTHLTRVEKPIAIDSQATIMALHLKDVDAFRPTFEAMMQKFAERFETKTLGSQTYYQFKVEPRDNDSADAPPRPQPCVALLEGCLIATDRPSAMEQIIVAPPAAEDALAAALDFKLIASKAKRLSGGAEPGMLIFRRPEEGMRMLYGLATEADSRDRIRRQGENSGFFKAIDQALEANPLPPFEVLAPYFAPGGAVLYNDETGFHYTGFTFRRK